MGIIMRNGIPYGGTDNDFTIADSLDSIENPKKEHLYSVDQRLYYWDEEWKPYGGGEIPEIEADEGDIVIGNGKQWIKGGIFKQQEDNFDFNGHIGSETDLIGFNVYSNVKINKIGIQNNLENEDTFALFSGSFDINDIFSTPFLAINGDSKCFLRDACEIDIGGKRKYDNAQLINTVSNEDYTKWTGENASLRPTTGTYSVFPHIRIHGNVLLEMDNSISDTSLTPLGLGPKIRIHGNPIIDIDNGVQATVFKGGPKIMIHGQPNIAIEDIPRINIQDGINFTMQNQAMFSMIGFDGSESFGPTLSPSPIFSMSGHCSFVMNTTKDEEYGPGIAINPSQIAIAGRWTSQNNDSFGSTQVNGFDGGYFPSVNSPNSLKFSNLGTISEKSGWRIPNSPVMVINDHSFLDFDSNGSFYIKGGGQSNSESFILIDPGNSGLLSCKIAPKSSGTTNIIIEGHNLFYKMDDNIHSELLNGSFFIMKKELEKSKGEWYSSPDFSEIASTKYYNNIDDFLNYTIDGRTNQERVDELISNLNNNFKGNKFFKEYDIFYLEKNQEIVHTFQNSQYLKIKYENLKVQFSFEYKSSTYYANKDTLISAILPTLKNIFGDNINPSFGGFSRKKSSGIYTYESDAVIYNATYWLYSSSYLTSILDPSLNYEKDVEYATDTFIKFKSSIAHNDLETSLQQFTGNSYAVNFESDSGYSTKAIAFMVTEDESPILIPHLSIYRQSSHLNYMGIDYSKFIDANNGVQKDINTNNISLDGPVFQMYTNSIFAMRGSDQKTEDLKRYENSPLFDVRDQAEIILANNTKIKAYVDETKGWIFQIGTHGVDGTDNPDDLVEFTLADLKALKQLLN